MAGSCICCMVAAARRLLACSSAVGMLVPCSSQLANLSRWPVIELRHSLSSLCYLTPPPAHVPPPPLSAWRLPPPQAAWLSRWPCAAPLCMPATSARPWWARRRSATRRRWRPAARHPPWRPSLRPATWSEWCWGETPVAEQGEGRRGGRTSGGVGEWQQEHPVVAAAGIANEAVGCM